MLRDSELLLAVQTLTGLAEPGGPDWVYVPFEVSTGTRELRLHLDYQRDAGALELGVFDPRGHGPHAPGFRGWSGAARSTVLLAPGRATPGYLAGALHPGTWHALLGPIDLVAPLEWRLDVWLRHDPAGSPPAPEEERSAPAVRAARPRQRLAGWYRGDLHVHTVYSDGSWLPAEVVAQARAAGLDFVASTEHNHPAAEPLWAPHADPAGLLVLIGEEVTTPAGHWGAIGLPAGTWVDWRYRAHDGRHAAAVARVRSLGGLAIANHPFAPFERGVWRHGWDGMDAIEVWNGGQQPDRNEPAVAAWDALLRAGHAPVAVAGSDAHRPPDVVGRPHTVVHAAAPAAAELLDGLRAGRSYLAADATVELRMEARAGAERASFGGRLAGPADERVEVRLRVRGAPGAVATLHCQRGVAHTAPVAGADDTVRWTATRRELAWLRAEVRRGDGALVALGNPIWFPQAAG
jgi:PHP-associated